MRLRLAAGIGGLVSMHAAAAEAVPPPQAGLSGGLLQAVFGLAVVLALIWAAAWAMRRLQPAAGGARGVLRLVGAQSVGQRERIVVVEVADQWLVVGVAPGSVSALATLPKGELPPTAGAPAHPFQALLARARREGSGERTPE